MKKRKIKRYRSGARNSGMKFAGILAIIIAAVICGYLTARFVIAPLLGYDTEVLKLDFPSKLTSILDGKETKGSKDAEDFSAETAGEETAQEDSQKENGEETALEDEPEEEPEKASEQKKGYALQFGVFLEEERAEKLRHQLEEDGIEVKVREKDGKYQVTGPLLKTKQEAVTKLKSTTTSHVSGIFITMI